LGDKSRKTENEGLHEYQRYRFAWFGSKTEPPLRNSAAIAKEVIVAV
jgi:hypothetical protein